jgi:undecaprenyl diphosphate synthase
MPEKFEKLQVEKLPLHIAIIMDGNGRWAAARNLPRMAGHRAGTENLRRIIKSCVRFGIRYLTIYAFSTENWTRPKDEVQGLMRIMGDVLEKEVPELHEQGVQLRHIGRLEQLDNSTQNKIRKAIEMTKDNHRLILNVAWNYGGRDEIIHAVQEITVKGIPPEDITNEVMSAHLYTSGIPDPDLVIRTSGEIRVSNFLIWQSAYSEWYFTETLWPDFNEDSLKAAIEDFSTRDRRYGGRKPAQKQEKYAG